MIKLIKKLWSDPVGSNVIAALIAAAIIGGVSWGAIRFFGWWPSIKSGGAEVLAWLGGTTSVSNWLLLLMGLATATVIVFAVFLLWAAARSSPAGLTVSFKDYVQDDFFGLRWRWRYSQLDEIHTVVAFCPTCDYQIQPRHVGYRAADILGYQCDDCGVMHAQLDGPEPEIASRVIRKVHQKLRSGDWVEAVNAMQERRKAVASKITASTDRA